jgi:hypothetical protein
VRRRRRRRRHSPHRRCADIMKFLPPRAERHDPGSVPGALLLRHLLQVHQQEVRPVRTTNCVCVCVW